MASLAGLAQGATYYVSTGGSDSNPGTQSAPFRHVSKGAKTAHAGDTVIVMNGTYDNEGKVADSNATSVVYMSNSGSSGAPITIMAQNRGGAILNLASVASSVGLADRFAYSMTKGAVLTMTYSVARDYVGHKIRCNAISPGRVHTPFVDGFLAKNYPGREREMFDEL